MAHWIVQRLLGAQAPRQFLAYQAVGSLSDDGLNLSEFL